MKKALFIFLILLFSNVSFGQLTNFSLQVAATNETCSGNGSLSFTASNTTAGASIIYNIYRLPDTTTPIAVTSANSFTGLVAGNYRVVATQSLGALSNSQQQDAVITRQIVLLTYDLVGENEVCGNDGKITVNVTQGNAVSYEIISGPMIRPLQTSNIFTGLTMGTYQVRVFDNCGEAIVQNLNLARSNPNIIINNHFVNGRTCETLFVINQINSGTSNLTNVIAYPLTIEHTVFPPSGSPIVLNQTLANGNPIQQPIYCQIPYFYNQMYTYNLKITDACGNVFQKNDNIIYEQVELNIYEVQNECGKALIVSPQNCVSPFTVNFVSAPSGFDPLVFNSNHPGPFYMSTDYFNSSIPYPEGTYVVQITDACGRTVIESYITMPLQVAPLNVYESKGCGVNEGSVLLICTDGLLQSVTITAAPSTYTTPLPHDVSYNIRSDGGAFSMNSLPAGTYTFESVDSCNLTRTSIVNIVGHQILSNEISIIENCNSFDIDLNHSSNLAIESIWLQKYDLTANQWVHPQTGFSNSQYPNFSNSIPLTNNAVNFNMAYSGTFRIIKLFNVSGNGDEEMVKCFEILYTFEFNGEPKIKDIYSFSCNDGFYDIIIDAVGIAPLIYRITKKNGLPFVIDNGTSNIFSHLPAAVYNFQVEDACGNVLNRSFEINREFLFTITAEDLCAGQAGSLSLPNFSFLQYEWWKGNDTTTILSTSNSLQFTSFNVPSDFGVYHVRVTNPGNPNSCIDFVLDYETSSNMGNVNAGNDSIVTYCGSQGAIDLFSLLSGPYDVNGVWQEITSSGTLTNNLWDSAVIVPGTYSFKYTVNGLCGNFDEAEVDITIKSIPQTPVASVDPDCNSGKIHLYATDIPEAVYQWTGPNGFVSNEQNPVIDPVSTLNEGTYSVSVVTDGCSSGFSVVDVLLCTECDIPSGISPNDDGLNDTFDLSCLQGVVNVKIFNRYGMNVFDLDNYVDQWDGHDFKGRLLPTATYYYVVRFDTGDVKTGWVYLNY